MQKIIVKNVSKVYGENSSKVIANDNISFEISEGEFVVILGPSGAGKSTLLNIIGGMDNASEGSINVFGKEIVGLNEDQLTKYRREDIGFVFQFYNLIPNLTVLENVELAGQIVKQPKKASETLKLVGLENRMDNFPSQISGGEQQRVAIATRCCSPPDICDGKLSILFSNPTNFKVSDAFFGCLTICPANSTFSRTVKFGIKL